MMTFAEIRHRLWHGTVDHLDPPLLAITLAIMGVGLATVFSATYDSQNRLMSQFINMAVALALMWGVAQLPPQKLMRFAVPLYVIGLILLVMVFLFGIKVNGARRWLNIGITRIQPSEIMKLAMPLMLALVLPQIRGGAEVPPLRSRGAVAARALRTRRQARSRNGDPHRRRRFLRALLRRPAVEGHRSAWRLQARRRPVLWTFLHDYQKKRILTLIDRPRIPLGSGYHIIQASIAIGSGGPTGKGLAAGYADAPGVHPRKAH